MSEMKNLAKDTPSPGSEEAVEKGCSCPILDNAHGKGYLGMPGLFVYSADCPLHFTESQPSQNEDEGV